MDDSLDRTLALAAESKQIESNTAATLKAQNNQIDGMRETVKESKDEQKKNKQLVNEVNRSFCSRVFIALICCSSRKKKISSPHRSPPSVVKVVEREKIPSDHPELSSDKLTNIEILVQDIKQSALEISIEASTSNTKTLLLQKDMQKLEATTENLKL